MNYKAYIYIVNVLIATFVVSGINFNNFFIKNKKIEARLFIVMLTLSMAYLSSKFIIEFIECSKII